MATKAMSRPAIVDRAMVLENELRSVRFLHHRLLDFEDEHQRVIDEAAELAAPGISRCARIVAKLSARVQRSNRTTKGTWAPPIHTAWLTSCREMMRDMRAKRNADPRWKSALKWGDTPGDDAPERGGIRRKATETDDAFSERCAKRRTTLTRREAWRKRIYDAHVATGATERSRVYWGTWNQLLKQVDQARAMVIKARAGGMPAEIRRPKRNDRITLAADAGGFKIIDRGGGERTSKNGATIGNPWWTIEQRVAGGTVRYRAKLGNWHELPEGHELRTCSLTFDGKKASVSIVVRGMPDEHDFAGRDGKRDLLDGQGLVALDWGHREHGHPGAASGMRVFAWLGDDGARGEIQLPVECRELVDSIDSTKSRLDDAFNARKSTLFISHRNRFGYRRSLERSGVLTLEQSNWLKWESKNEKRMARARRRIDNLRRETYLKSIRKLRELYGTFAIEDETTTGHRKRAKADMDDGRKRQNRELSARYMFTQFCERLGASVLPVPSRNTTRECPTCGHLDENTAELTIVCSACGVARDKDFGAAEVILRRAKESLAKLAQAA